MQCNKYNHTKRKIRAAMFAADSDYDSDHGVVKKVAKKRRLEGMEAALKLDFDMASSIQVV
jgi:hypothetical protein